MQKIFEFLDLGTHKKKKKKIRVVKFTTVSLIAQRHFWNVELNESIKSKFICRHWQATAFSCILLYWSSLPISSLAQPECLPSGKVWKTGSFWEICQFSRKFSKKAGNCAQVTLNQENCYLEWLWRSDLCAKRKQSFQLNPTESANDGTFSAGFESVEPDRFGWISWHMIQSNLIVLFE